MDLKKELEFRRRQILQLEQEGKEKDQRLFELENQCRRFQEQSTHAETTLQNLDRIIEERTAKAAAMENQKYRNLVAELEKKNGEMTMALKAMEMDKKSLNERDSEVEFLRNRLKEMADNYGVGDAMRDIRIQRDENLSLRKEVERLTRDWTDLSRQTQDVVSENRVLREMAGVPENYGFNLEDIKLAEQQKLEEYRARVKRLETEVEELEKERAELRYRLRNMSTLYGEKGVRFHGLTEEQMEKVDEFARNLKEGKLELPMTDRTRELLREVERLKAQLQVYEGLGYHGPDTSVKPGVSEELLEQFRKETKELKDLLMQLHTNPQPVAQGTDSRQQVNVLQLPPVPILNEQGKYQEGYSYRFGTKLPVQQIWTGDTARDLAGLQLQIVETLELLSRRDEAERLTGLELEEFRSRMREVLLVQEVLYKEYQDERTKQTGLMQQLQTQHDTMISDLRETRVQLTHYEEMAKTIQSGTERAKLAELTQRIALLDVNNLRLARKYDCLLSEEKDLREAYHTFEAEHAEKDVAVQKRLGKLGEWKVRASMQLQFLFKQLRNSVSLDDFEQLQMQLQALREKQANWLEREVQLYKRVARFENMERENHEIQEKLKSMEETRLDLQTEFEVVCKRLEALDPAFHIEQAVFRRIVTQLQASHLSTQQAFSVFDKDKNGRISKAEFKSALDNLGVKLSPNELDNVLRSIDSDRDTGVNYAEFSRKLERFGMTSESEEQQILQTIYESIRRLNYTLHDVFMIFDSDGNGTISRKEFIDCFHKFGLGLTTVQIEKIAKLVDANTDGNISFEEFRRIFDRGLNLQPEEKKAFSLDWKDQIFSRINESIKKNNLDLSEAFSVFDENKDGRINKSEFLNVFRRMNIGLSPAQMDELWNSMNSDRDGSISYVEFISQFKASVRQIESNRVVREAEAAAANPALASSEMPHERERRQIVVLEAREQAALNKAERYNSRLKGVENALSEMEAQMTRLEAKNIALTQKYEDATGQLQEAKTLLFGTLSKAECERLRQNNEILQKELAEARAAMNSYKGMVQVSADQVRTLQMSLERRKDEVVTYQQAIRELEAASIEAVGLGKLYHQVMVSRWAEASANRKYDSLQGEIRNLRDDCYRLEGESMSKEKDLKDTQQVLTEKVTDYEKQIGQLKARAEHNITLEKAQEYVQTIQDFAKKKSELEDTNRKLRSDYLVVQGQVEEAQLVRIAAEEAAKTLRLSSPDEISTKLLELTEKLSEYKLNDLKSRRESAQCKESEEYMRRLRGQDEEEIHNLQVELARWEEVMARKEETWRKKDDERQRLLLNPKFKPSSDRLESVLRSEPASEAAKREEEVERLRLRIKHMEDMILVKDEQLEHVTQIRREAEAVGSSLTRLPPARGDMTQSQVLQAVGEEEANKLAQAAGRTISTLQEMIDHKNNQLDRKEEIVTRLKKEILDQQAAATREVNKLSEEIEELRRAQLAANPVPSQSFRSPGLGYRPEVDQLLNNKDSRITQLASGLEASRKAKEMADKRIDELNRELEKCRYELNIERTQNSSVQLTRELTKLRTTLKTRDKELAKLKEAFEQLKNDLVLQVQEKSSREKQVAERNMQEGAENTTILIQMKKSEQRLKELADKLREASMENKRIKEELMVARATETKLKENLMAKQETMEKIMKEGRGSMSRRPETAPAEQDVQGLREQVRALQEENQKLRTVDPKSAKPADPKNPKEPKKAKEPKQPKKPKEPKAPKEPKPLPHLEPAQEALLRQLGLILRNKGKTILNLDPQGRKELTNEMLERLLVTAQLGLSEEDVGSIVMIASSVAFINIKTSPEDDGEMGIKMKAFAKVIDQILAAVIKSAPAPREQTEQIEAKRNEMALQRITDERDKLAKRVEVLTLQVGSQAKDLDSLMRQLDHWKEHATGLERDRAAVVNRLEAEVPAGMGTLTMERMEGLEDLRREISELQDHNQALEKRIGVTLAGDLRTLQEEKRVLAEENKRIKVEILQIRSQLEKAKRQRMQGADVREEEMYDRDMMITRLSERVQELERAENEASQAILQGERVNMELKFEKETFSLQLARLQRRIRDLEQFKNVAVREGVRPDAATTSMKATVRFQDPVEPQQPAAQDRPRRELEQVVEQLKKVIEKQRQEIEHLKRTAQSSVRVIEKAQEGKLAKVELEQMQNEIKELRSREEINRDLQLKLKKVNEANELLRKDIEREIHLVEEADDKYRALMVQYEVVIKDNERLRSALERR